MLVRFMTLAGQPSAAVVTAIALAPLLAGTAQLAVEHAALGPVAPDIPRDGFVIDGQLPRQFEIPRDLFRAPLLHQPGVLRLVYEFAGAL